MRSGFIGRAGFAGLCMVVAGLAGTAANGQAIDGHEFIEWHATELPLAPTPSDAAFIEFLREGMHSYGVRNNVISIHFFADGNIDLAAQLVLDYVDEAGIEMQGNGLIYVNAFSEKLRVEEAYATTADGHVIPVEESTVQVLLEDDGGVFSDNHTVVIPWPNLAKGSATTLSYRLTSHADARAVPWSTILFPQSSVPTRQFTLNVTWDEGAEPPVVDSDALHAGCETTKFAISCTASNVESVASDFDVNYYDVLGQIVVAEPTSWHELSGLLRSYVENSWTDDEEVAATVERVIAGADTEIQKLEALHSFVAGSIRYVAIETGVNGVVPRDTGLTLGRRYGDCKDKTALFLHMAEIAGISAVPVVVSSHRKNLNKLETPGLAYFDHMVACVDLGGEVQCIDLTDPYTPTAEPPFYLSNAVALLLDKERSTLGQMPKASSPWRLAVVSENVIEGGTIHETERRSYHGSYAGRMRANLMSLNSAERQRWAKDRYDEIFATDDISMEFLFSGIDDQQSPVTVETQATYENSILTGRDLDYQHYPGWMVDLIWQFESTNEHFDYDFSGFSYNDTTTFALEEWSLVAPGSAIDFRSEFGSMKRSYQIRPDGRSIAIETIVDVPARNIKVDEVDRFRKFLETLVSNSTVRFRARPL